MTTSRRNAPGEVEAPWRGLYQYPLKCRVITLVPFKVIELFKAVQVIWLWGGISFLGANQLARTVFRVQKWLFELGWQNPLEKSSSEIAGTEPTWQRRSIPRLIHPGSVFRCHSSPNIDSTDLRRSKVGNQRTHRPPWGKGWCDVSNSHCTHDDPKVVNKFRCSIFSVKNAFSIRTKLLLN